VISADTCVRTIHVLPRSVSGQDYLGYPPFLARWRESWDCLAVIHPNSSSLQYTVCGTVMRGPTLWEEGCCLHRNPTMDQRNHAYYTVSGTCTSLKHFFFRR